MCSASACRAVTAKGLRDCSRPRRCAWNTTAQCSWPCAEERGPAGSRSEKSAGASVDVCACWCGACDGASINSPSSGQATCRTLASCNCPSSGDAAVSSASAAPTPRRTGCRRARITVVVLTLPLARYSASSPYYRHGRTISTASFRGLGTSRPRFDRCQLPQGEPLQLHDQRLHPLREGAMAELPTDDPPPRPPPLHP